MPGLDPERRRYPRVKAEIPVELSLLGSSAPMRTAIHEISLCGCYIESMFTMDVGTKVQLAFSLGETTGSASGIVVTKYPQVGNGIDFISMSPEDRLKLHDFIAELDRDAASGKAGSTV
ncbi:MAG TPA: PilZ domain-containing protein [Terriglobales bacterium]|nr:PilZ domain-containing protein [Terriglobales bacterium]